MWNIHPLQLFWVFKYYRNYIKLLLLIFMMFTIYILIILSKNKKVIQTDCAFSSVPESSKHPLPLVRIYGIEREDKTLDIIKSVLLKMGYRTEMGSFTNWELLWSHTYPFYTLANELVNLKPYQKVNHFPGSGFITQKTNLAALNISQMPKSFFLPSDKEKFLAYSERNVNNLWVLKSISHRGISILSKINELQLNESFIQKFIKNPLIISGKKFDIGVYVMLTSVDPLRVYVYSGDILLRFCRENYYPLNLENTKSYVVGDDYLPVWEVPDLKFYYSKLNYTAKESLNAYFHSQGKNPKILWKRINDIIQDVYFRAEDNIKKSSLSIGSLRNFFELVRFDFIADEEFNIFLLEVNMSPNLSAAHFPKNNLLYTQVIFSSLNLVGLTRKFHDFFTYRGEAEVSEKDIQVYSKQCTSQICQNSCQYFKCKHCNWCLTREMKEIAKSAYLEFMNRGKYRRVVPVPRPNVNTSDVIQINNLSEMNLFMDAWFKGKCREDEAWCG